MENIVYCFTFPNEKKYIGKTQQGLDIRLRSHRYGTKHIQNYLYNVIIGFCFIGIKLYIKINPYSLLPIIWLSFIFL